METADERAAALYETLGPEGTEAARKHVLSRTPVELQEAMLALVDIEFPLPTPPEPPVADPVEDPVPA